MLTGGASGAGDAKIGYAGFAWLRQDGDGKDGDEVKSSGSGEGGGDERLCLFGDASGGWAIGTVGGAAANQQFFRSAPRAANAAASATAAAAAAEAVVALGGAAVATAPAAMNGPLLMPHQVAWGKVLGGGGGGGNGGGGGGGGGSGFKVMLGGGGGAVSAAAAGPGGTGGSAEEPVWQAAAAWTPFSIAVAAEPVDPLLAARWVKGLPAPEGSPAALAAASAVSAGGAGGAGVSVAGRLAQGSALAAGPAAGGATAGTVGAAEGDPEALEPEWALVDPNASAVFRLVAKPASPTPLSPPPQSQSQAAQAPLVVGPSFGWGSGIVELAGPAAAAHLFGTFRRALPPGAGAVGVASYFVRVATSSAREGGRPMTLSLRHDGLWHVARLARPSGGPAGGAHGSCSGSGRVFGRSLATCRGVADDATSSSNGGTAKQQVPPAKGVWRFLEPGLRGWFKPAAVACRGLRPGLLLCAADLAELPPSTAGGAAAAASAATAATTVAAMAGAAAGAAAADAADALRRSGCEGLYLLEREGHDGKPCWRRDPALNDAPPGGGVSGGGKESLWLHFVAAQQRWQVRTALLQSVLSMPVYSSSHANLT